GAGLVDDELVHAGFDIGLEHAVEGLLRNPWVLVRLRHPVVQRAVERLGVAANLAAVVVEHLIALTHLRRRTERVPRIRVPGDDLEHARPERAEHERRPGLLHARRTRTRIPQSVIAAVERARVLARHQVHALDRFLEPDYPLSRLRKVAAEHRLLGLVPARSESDLEPAAGDVIDRHGHLGQDLRVAKSVGGDQDADADLPCDGRQAAEKGPGFAVGPVGPARLNEVVAEPRALIAKAFEELPPLDGLLPRHVLVGADAESEPTCHWLLLVLSTYSTVRLKYRAMASGSAARPMWPTRKTLPESGPNPPPMRIWCSRSSQDM